MGLMDNYFKDYQRLKAGANSSWLMDKFSDTMSESEIRKIQRQVATAYHDFDPNSPTFGYFLSINYEILFIGFDYNIKLGISPPELSDFFEEISREKGTDGGVKAAIESPEKSEKPAGELENDLPK